MSMRAVKVLLFGVIAERVQASEVFLPDVANTDELKAALVSQFPQLDKMKYLVTVNRHVAQQCEMLTHDCEIALLPPYSGG